MNAVEIITRKRDSLELESGQIRWLIGEYVSGRIPDYQMSAWLMAVYFNGMSRKEMRDLTECMVKSGESMDLSSIPGLKVDKHSTGGVGDKVSLVLAPLVAAAGIPVPMMAGRGLGHTGGTLDKLEAIPGFRTRLSPDEFVGVIKKAGFAITGQTDAMVPADRMLYSLRDVTGTVPSIPLISSSILSKKKAEGTDALVLDVKTGRGAFLQDRTRTEELAQTLVELGEELGIRTVAVLTRMDQPLGNAVGNLLELQEAVLALQGKGPQDLMDVTLALGAMMLLVAGKSDSLEKGLEILRRLIDSGEGYKRFLSWVAMQGGDADYAAACAGQTSRAKYSADVTCPCSGYVQSIDAYQVGILATDLGAGRHKKEDSVDYNAGILFKKKIGDKVEKGDVLARLFTEKQDRVKPGLSRLLDSYQFGEKPVPPAPLIDCWMDLKGRHSFKVGKGKSRAVKS